MAINKIPVKAFTSGDLALDTFTATAGQTAVTLSISATDNSVIVTVNDVLQVPPTDYSVNGTTLTFTSALALNDSIVVRIIARPSVFNAVEDGSISSAKLSSNLVLNGNSITMPAGSTAQRPVVAIAGMLRYNTDFGLLEQYNTNGWQAIDAPPLVSGVSPTSYNGEQNTTIAVNGSNFKSGAYVTFVDNNNVQYNASSTSFVSGNSLSATTPQDFTVAQGPMTIKVTNPSGLSTSLVGCLSTGVSPAWSTASGSIGTFGGGSISTSVLATDSDAGSTISYSVVSGSLPSGVSLNTSTGAITGSNTTPQNTTYNFTIRATDNANNTSDRAFTMSLMINYFGAGADGAGSY